MSVWNIHVVITLRKG